MRIVLSIVLSSVVWVFSHTAVANEHQAPEAKPAEHHHATSTHSQKKWLVDEIRITR